MVWESGEVTQEPEESLNTSEGTNLANLSRPTRSRASVVRSTMTAYGRSESVGSSPELRLEPSQMAMPGRGRSTHGRPSALVPITWRGKEPALQATTA